MVFQTFPAVDATYRSILDITFDFRVLYEFRVNIIEISTPVYNFTGRVNSAKKNFHCPTLREGRNFFLMTSLARHELTTTGWLERELRVSKQTKSL